MEYVEVEFTLKEIDPWRDLLAAELGEIGFESFVETEEGLLGYIQIDLFDENIDKKYVSIFSR